MLSAISGVAVPSYNEFRRSTESRSCLIGDESTHTAVVVDPQRDVDRYLAFASERGLVIKHVILTHLHADFVAGHLELRDRAGATIYLD